MILQCELYCMEFAHKIMNRQVSGTPSSHFYKPKQRKKPKERG